MDFDLSKENIQPLRGGRNPSQLEMALQAQTNQELQFELQKQKEEFESAITNYSGEDPLDLYYQYISWVEQSYPKHGHEGDLLPLLEHCLSKFEHDSRYTEDRRFCKLWIKFIDLQQNPLELYHMMYARGLCRGCADMYRAWAYYHEAGGDFQNANNVLEQGKSALAQPFDELETACQNLLITVGQYNLYGEEAFQTNLTQKRQALTSLHAYKPGRVGSARIPSGGAPGGFLPSGAEPARSNAPVTVFEDRGGPRFQGPEAAPMSIVAVAKRQDARKENTIKPGPWTTVPSKRRAVGHRPQLGFTVHEDSDNQDEIKNFHSLRPKTTLEDYSNWVLPIYHPEDPDPRMKPMYPKNRVYIDPLTEYSLEELRSHHKNYKTKTNQNNSLKNKSVNSSFFNQQDLVSNNTSIQMSFHNQRSAPFEIHNQTPPMPQHHQEISHMQSFQNQSPFQVKNQSVSIQNQPQNQLMHHSEITLPQVQINGTQINSFNESHTGRFSAMQHHSIKPLTDSVSIVETIDLADSDSETPVESNDAWIKAQVKLNWSPDSNSCSPLPTEKQGGNKIMIFEESLSEQPALTQPKGLGSAMKTPFKVLSSDDFAETGSRGGMDIATTAQPTDSARPMSMYNEDSTSSFDAPAPRLLDAPYKSNIDDLNLSCNTQMFNLNCRVVSTPDGKKGGDMGANLHQPSPIGSKKQLFADNNCEQQENILSTIMEESKDYCSSHTSSSGATTKSSAGSTSNQTTKLATIEEHNSYLQQNFMANEELRRSILGDLFTPQINPVQEAPPMETQSSSLHSPVRAAPNIVKPLDCIPSNPFRNDVIHNLLGVVNFPGPHSEGYIPIHHNVKMAVKKDPVCIGSDQYVMEKQLGKGTFGVVYKAIDRRDNMYVALKYQKPPNKWEYYICREIQARLNTPELRRHFMDVFMGYFHDQFSILVSEYMPCGSLLDLANIVKQKSGKSLKESLCIYFTSEMLKVVKTLHDINIIHADIKPDNFLIMCDQQNMLHLQLIDFGCSIDMTLYPPNAMFSKIITTENFVCCEMRDKRPWNYHTDLFCVAASAHVLLFDKYITLQKINNHWSITSKLPRYSKIDLWNMVFSSLLNQQNGPADAASLIQLLDDVNNDTDADMRYAVNLLKNQ